jgi:hypothetical protein
VHSLVPQWYVAAKAHLDAVFADASGDTTGDAAAAAAQDRDAPTPLPFAGTSEAEQELAATNGASWKLLDECRLDPERPLGRGGYHRKSDLQVSTTDPDATLLRPPDSGRLGYHDHYAVDGGKARIILAALVTPADVTDNIPMLDLLSRVRFRYQLHPAIAVGDTTYGTIDNIRALEDAGIRACVPVRVFEEKTPFYPPTRFTYHPAFDVYQCPQGQLLVRDCIIYATEVVRYQAEAATCNACPVKDACTTSTTGRQIHRSFYADQLERVRAYHTAAPYQKAMRKRAVWVEPLFGEAKEWHGLRTFRLRGLWKVNCEGLRIAAGQNLKRWLSRMGWGRRHGPAGSLALAVSGPMSGVPVLAR